MFSYQLNMDILRFTTLLLVLGATQTTLSHKLLSKTTEDICSVIDCSIGLPKKLIPGDIEQCANGVYCECDSKGVAHKEVCPLPEIFHAKLNPKTQDCDGSFDCEAWFEDQTTKGPDASVPTTETEPPRDGCAVVDCTIAEKQLIPSDLEKCESGVYCECNALGLAAEKHCPEQEKFDPETKKCELSFDCKSWFEGIPTKEPEVTSSPTTEPPRQLCPASIDCGIAKKQLIPGDIAKCESGKYCECDSNGVAFEQTCPQISLFQMKFDPAAAECEILFDCQSWFETVSTKAVDATTPPTTPQPNACSEIDCGVGEMQLIPGDLDSCESGVYCECDGWGVAHKQTCPQLSSSQSKFDPETEDCEFSFDCNAWFHGLTRSTPPGRENICIAIDCSIADKQLIPGDLDKCESGLYCECDGFGVAYENTCPPLSKFDPDTKDCQYAFDCRTWMERTTTKRPITTANYNDPPISGCSQFSSSFYLLLLWFVSYFLVRT